MNCDSGGWDPRDSRPAASGGSIGDRDMKLSTKFGAWTAAALCLALAPTARADEAASWPMFGQSPSNLASQPAETRLSTATVAGLTTAWTLTAAGNVSARPAIVNGVAYLPDWGGKLWALNAKTGAVIWSHAITDYGFPAGPFSRTSPAVDNGVLFIGTRPGAYLLAINAATGALIWSTQLESHPVAWLTASDSSSMLQLHAIRWLRSDIRVLRFFSLNFFFIGFYFLIGLNSESFDVSSFLPGCCRSGRRQNKTER